MVEYYCKFLSSSTCSKRDLPNQVGFAVHVRFQPVEMGAWQSLVPSGSNLRRGSA